MPADMLGRLADSFLAGVPASPAATGTSSANTNTASTTGDPTCYAGSRTTARSNLLRWLDHDAKWVSAVLLGWAVDAS
ncbi:hypothetical protein [Verminephrobacter eiseniae]|uniref:hypothetical protein n=1 Tax=Verminephrobacter eiseniae TaxID=364317 RepID=UPI0018DE8D2F|nr:hypothetical protein [Verminephrobacter eiseniae]